MWKRGEIAPLFHNIFNMSLSSGVKLPIHLLNVVVRFIVFLTSATLIFWDTDISKCFRESLRIRDNEGRLYFLYISTPFTSNYFLSNQTCWSLRVWGNDMLVYILKIADWLIYFEQTLVFHAISNSLYLMSNRRKYAIWEIIILLFCCFFFLVCGCVCLFLFFLFVFFVLFCFVFSFFRWFVCCFLDDVVVVVVAAAAAAAAAAVVVVVVVVIFLFRFVVVVCLFLFILFYFSGYHSLLSYFTIRNQPVNIYLLSSIISVCFSILLC